MGRVEITVCAARKLHDHQLVGMPDPYVRLTCGDKRYKTKVVDNNLDPVWNETFRFQIPDEASTQIRLEVWNKNIYDDDLMGFYTLSLGGLTRGIVKDQWYILQKSKTEAELHVRVLAVDFGQQPTEANKWMVTSDITVDPVLFAINAGKWRPGQEAPPSLAPPQQSTPAAQPPTNPQFAPQPQQAPYVQYAPAPQPQPSPYAQYAPAPQPQQAPYVQYAPVPQPQPTPYVQYAPVPPPTYMAGPQPVYAQPPPVQPSYYAPPAAGYSQPPPQPGYRY